MANTEREPAVEGRRRRGRRKEVAKAREDTRGTAPERELTRAELEALRHKLQQRYHSGR